MSRGNANSEEMFRGNANSEAASSTEETSYLSKQTKTKMPGNQTIMLDIGSMVNVIGKDTLAEFQDAATPYGYEVRYEDREIPLNLSGVGSGAARCTQTAEIPVAVQFKDKQPTLEHYKTNVATGSGSNLPAIMGKKSMSDKDAVILLRDGEEMIAFPGPGGYKIEWSPGTKLMSLNQLPSGHLAFKCDMYAKLKEEPNKTAMTFVTDHTKEGQPQE